MAQINWLGLSSEVAADAGEGERTKQFDDALPKAVGGNQKVAHESGATLSNAIDEQVRAYHANETFEKA